MANVGILEIDVRLTESIDVITKQIAKLTQAINAYTVVHSNSASSTATAKKAHDAYNKSLDTATESVKKSISAQGKSLSSSNALGSANKSLEDKTGALSKAQEVEVKVVNTLKTANDSAVKAVDNISKSTEALSNVSNKVEETKNREVNTTKAVADATEKANNAVKDATKKTAELSQAKTALSSRSVKEVDSDKKATKSKKELTSSTQENISIFARIGSVYNNAVKVLNKLASAISAPVKVYNKLKNAIIAVISATKSAINTVKSFVKTFNDLMKTINRTLTLINLFGVKLSTIVKHLRIFLAVRKALKTAGSIFGSNEKDGNKTLSLFGKLFKAAKYLVFNFKKVQLAVKKALEWVERFPVVAEIVARVMSSFKIGPRAIISIIKVLIKLRNAIFRIITQVAEAFDLPTERIEALEERMSITSLIFGAIGDKIKGFAKKVVTYLTPAVVAATYFSEVLLGALKGTPFTAAGKSILSWSRRITKSRTPIKHFVKDIDKMLTSFGELKRFVKLSDFNVFTKGFGAIRSGAVNAQERYAKFAGTVKTARNGFKNASKAAQTVGKSIYGVADAASLLGPGLVTLGALMRQSDSVFIRVAGTIAMVAGTLMTGFGYAVLRLSDIIGSFVLKAGNSMVSFFVDSTKRANEADSAIFTFRRTIEGLNRISEASVGTTKEWANSIDSISKSSTFSTKELRKSALEIALVGKQSHLSAKQMETLLSVSADYAALQGKDLFNTTVAIISGINGATQAAGNYGLKLNEVALQGHLFDKKQTKRIKDLTEYEKVQERFNMVMSQAVPVIGTASSSAATLAMQEKVLARNIKNVTEELGRGAAVIEDTNIVALMFNKIIESLNPTVVRTAGTIGALVSRIVQASGFFMKWSFAVYTAMKAYSLFMLAIKSDIASTAMFTQIPILGKSLNDLTTAVGFNIGKIKNLRTFLTQLASVFVQQGKVMIAMVLNIELAMMSWSTVMSTLVVRAVTLMKAAFLGAMGAIKSFFLFLMANPLVVILTAIAGAIVVLSKAAFSASEELDKLNKPIRKVASATKEVKKEVGILEKTYGFLTAAMAEAKQAWWELRLAFTKDKKARKELEALIDNAKLFTGRMRDAGWSIEVMNKKLDDAKRAIAGLKGPKIKIDTSELDSLMKRIDDFSMSRDEKLSKTFKKEMTLIKEAYSQGYVPSLTEFDALRNKLLNEYNSKQLEPIAELEKKYNNYGKTKLQILEDEFSRHFKLIDDALAKGYGNEKKLLAFRIKLERIFAAEKKKLQFQTGNPLLPTDMKGMNKLFAELSNRYKDVGKTQQEIIDQEYTLRMEQLELFKRYKIGSAKQISNLEAKIEIDLAKKKEDLAKKALEAEKERASNAIVSLKGGFTEMFLTLFGKGTLAAGITSIQESLATLTSTTSGKEALSALGSSIISTVKSGADGAKEMLVGIGSTIGDALLPGFGGMIGSILDMLMMAPDKFKEAIQGFITAIPELISNLLMNAMNFGEIIFGALERVAERWPSMVQTLITNLVEKLADPMYMIRLVVGLIAAIIKGIPKIIGAFIQGIKNGIENIFTKIKKDFGNLGKVFKDLKDGFNKLIDKIKSFFGFGSSEDGKRSGLGKVVGGVKDFFKKLFYKGGLVGGGPSFTPDHPRYDKVPAMLSKGEIVLPKSVVNNGIPSIIDFVKKLSPHKETTTDLPKNFANGGIVGNVSTPMPLDRSMIGPREQPKVVVVNNSNQYNDDKLDAIIELLGRPQQIRSDVKVNQRAFAKIMLDIDRNNMRVTA